jgi:putative hydrolase of the HAD superfamily
VSGARRVDAVLFDYGGVLTGPVRDSVRAWLAADGIETASYKRALEAWMAADAEDGTPVHRLETGELAAAEFEAALAAELRTVDGGRVDPAGVLSRLFAGMVPDAAMFALAEDLRDLGVRVGLLSNSWGNTYPRERIDELFSPVVISEEVGLRKPLAAIYELARDRLHVPAERVLFIDDTEPNVLGARRVGMQALLHVDARSTRAELARLVPDLDLDPTGASA